MHRYFIKYVYVVSLILSLLGGCFVLSVSPVDAATENPSLFFKMPTSDIGVGDEFSVTLSLDSGGQTVNTLSGDMEFTDPLLSLERVSTANSLVTSWVQFPTVSGNSVTFSGIMPGGYQSVVDPLTNARMNGTVITLVFKARAAGSATFSFSDSHLYLNDGLGTEIGITSLPYTFTINGSGSSRVLNLHDTVPPEAFTPVISSSPDLYNGAYALFFQTTDSGSGLDHYEVSEGGKDWVRAESPYLLSDQTLRSIVRVKAVDFANNYRIETIYSEGSFPLSLFLIPVIVVAGVLLCIFIFFKQKVKKIKKMHREIESQ